MDLSCCELNNDDWVNLDHVHMNDFYAEFISTF